jgi:TonB family protein
MKNKSMLVVLISAFAICQGCAPKAEDANQSTAEVVKTEDAEALAAKKAKDLAAKREKIAKASAEKEEQRRLAVIEKAKVSPTYKDASGKKVYYRAEVDPSYTGGTAEMRKFLKENIKYPESARENRLEGTVFVDFIVDEKGKVRDVTTSDIIGDDVDESFKAESVRVVSAMPGWKPGIQHGKAVDASFSIPITFELMD